MELVKSPIPYEKRSLLVFVREYSLIEDFSFDCYYSRPYFLHYHAPLLAKVASMWERSCAWALMLWGLSEILDLQQWHLLVNKGGRIQEATICLSSSKHFRVDTSHYKITHRERKRATFDKIKALTRQDCPCTWWTQIPSGTSTSRSLGNARNRLSAQIDPPKKRLGSCM